MQVVVHQGGTTQDVQPSPACEEETREAVRELIAGSTEEMRLLVTAEQLERVRTAEAVEITFTPAVTFESRALGSRTFHRILVPTGGDDIGAADDAHVTLYLGDPDGFQSPPILHPSGSGLARSIQRCMLPT